MFKKRNMRLTEGARFALQGRAKRSGISTEQLAANIANSSKRLKKFSRISFKRGRQSD